MHASVCRYIQGTAEIPPRRLFLLHTVYHSNVFTSILKQFGIYFYLNFFERDVLFIVCAFLTFVVFFLTGRFKVLFLMSRNIIKSSSLRACPSSYICYSSVFTSEYSWDFPNINVLNLLNFVHINISQVMHLDPQDRYVLS